MPPPGKRDQPARADIRAELDALEEAIEELRVAYEKYFVGVDRVAPVQLRDRVDRQLRHFLGAHLTSTAMRFRLHGLKARLTTYKHYWTRVENEMERGIYRRDVLRAARRQAEVTKAKAPQPADAAHAAEGAEAAEQEEQLGSIAANAAPKISPRRPEESANPQDAGLDPKHLREVFKQLVAAKRQAGESVEGLTYAALVKKLTREAPKLRAQSRGADVRFEVATVDGRVRLRAKTTKHGPAEPSERTG